MMRLKNTRYLSAFKGILAVIVVILFTSQLSYKFYQCASISFQGKQIYWQAQGQSAAHAMSFAYGVRHQLRLLSLDKRYDLKHIYYFPAAVCCLKPLPPGDYIETRTVAPKAVSHANLSTSLRAPPSIWL